MELHSPNTGQCVANVDSDEFVREQKIPMQDHSIDDRYGVDRLLQERAAGSPFAADLLHQPGSDLEALVRAKRKFVAQKTRMREQLVCSEITKRDRCLRRSEVPQ
jgi:hypothetical protein